MPNQENLKPTPEFASAPLIELAVNVLDSVEFATQSEDYRYLAEKIKAGFENLAGAYPLSEKLQERKMRPQDWVVFVPEEEHPGFSLRADYTDGRILQINIKGGIRKPAISHDFRDLSQFAKSTFVDRTLGVAGKQTDVNLHIMGAAGIKTHEIWLIDAPAPRNYIAITSMCCFNEETGILQRFSGEIAFSLKRQKGQYLPMHKSIRTAVESWLRKIEK